MTLFPSQTKNRWSNHREGNIFELAGIPRVSRSREITPDMDNKTIARIVSEDLMDIVNEQLEAFTNKQKKKK